MKAYFKSFTRSCIFILILVNLFLFISASMNKCNDLNEPFTLNSEEEDCVLFSSTYKERNSPSMYIRLLGMEIQYEIVNTYTYYHPLVEVKCNCTCDRFPDLCREKSCCSLSKNHTNILCLEFQENCENCQKRYNMCCETKVSFGNNSTKYRAIQLRKKSLSINLKISSLNSTENFPSKVVINSHQNKHLTNTDFIMIEFDQLFNSFIIPDGWYYHADTLMGGISVNELRGCDLNKVGWFQEDNSGNISFISESNLRQHLKVTLKQCQTNYVNYDWNLNAINFYKDKNLQSVKEGISLLNIYKNKIYGEKIDYKKKIVSFQLVNHGTTQLRFRHVASYQNRTLNNSAFVVNNDDKESTKSIVNISNLNTHQTFFKENVTFKFEIEKTKDRNISEHDIWQCLVNLNNSQLCLRGQLRENPNKLINKNSKSDVKPLFGFNQTDNNFLTLREKALIFGIILPSAAIVMIISIHLVYNECKRLHAKISECTFSFK